MRGRSEPAIRSVLLPPEPARRCDIPGSAISAEGLTRTFDELVAVSDLNLEVPTGSIVGLIGPSGSGKTTTIRMLIGSLEPSAGRLRVLGDDPARLKTRTRERIGYMPQGFARYADLTAAENVDFAASLYGLLLFRRRRRRRAVLELLDLWGVRNRRAGRLSGGMKRRLDLACALVHEPELLVLDEPTAGIDPILRRTVWDELHRLRDGGVTALVTTQYVTEAEECDVVALLSGGRLIGFAPPEELRRQALGGEILEVAARDVFDAATLDQLPFVRGTHQTGLREFQVVVDDAATATLNLVSAIEAVGGEVVSVGTFHPTFDDVFATLIKHDEEVRAAAPAGEPTPEPARALAAQPAPARALAAQPAPAQARPAEAEADPAAPEAAAAAEVPSAPDGPPQAPPDQPGAR
ncbi:MAG TPA: ABC transporter ATP-binding protein [Candidatus Eisenbacteria bacterium]|nr:ABC transporter ATP-binding protein [Candidatus Eisenbacteria bacterium]